MRNQLRATILEHDAQLTQYFDEWRDRFDQDTDHSDPALQFRAELLPL